MREIKFRAWDKISKSWIEKGFHVFGEVSCFDVVMGSMRERHFPKPTLEMLNDVEITQFTGLKDRNGKEIYESDVVVYRDISGSGRPREFGPREVRWYQDSCNFNVSRPSNGAEIEVIGNIYESPELLEGKS